MSEIERKDQYQNSVVYRIYPKSFYDSDGDGIGDFAGITAKIPYLSALGVDVIALTSIFESSEDRQDYGTTDFQRINPLLGTTDDFDQLLSRAHAAGIKVFLSVTLSCTSAEHDWFVKASESTDNPYRTYYIWQKGRGKKGNHAPDYQKDLRKESAWTYHEPTNEWYHHTYGEKYPTLNYDNPRLRKEILDVFRFWHERGVDGFIIDNAFFSIKKIILSDLKPMYKTNKTLFWRGGGLYHIILEIREKLGRDFPVILNAMNVKTGVYPYLVAGEMVTGDSVFAEHLISDLQYKADRSFNKKRFLHKFISLQKSICKHELSFLFEDHRHERLLSHFAQEGDDLTLVSKLLAGLLLTATATPILYQGQEIGMENFRFKKAFETALEKDNLHTCAPMQWDNTQHAAFTEGDPYLPINDNYNETNAASESATEGSTLLFYKALIAFRKASSALSVGSFDDHSKKEVLAYIRASETERLLIIANTANRHINYKVPSEFLEKDATCEISNYSVVSKAIFPTMGLRPYEIRIYRLKAPLLALN